MRWKKARMRAENGGKSTKPRRTFVNVQRAVWGPHLWKVFHGFGLALSTITDSQIRADKMRLAWQITGKLIHAIPCPECQYHASAMYNGSTPNYSVHDWYETWAFNFHNTVNSRLGKPVVTKEDAAQKSSLIDTVKEYEAYVVSINAQTLHTLYGVSQQVQHIAPQSA